MTSLSNLIQPDLVSSYISLLSTNVKMELGAVMFIIYQIGRMSIIMYLPCMVLGSLTGISVNLLIIIMGIIAIIYSYTGGLKSVLWTDFIQGSVLLIGVTFALIFLLAHLDGGFGAIAHALTTEHKFLAVDQPIFNANIFKDRLEELEEIKNALNIFKSKIKFTYEPIPEIFKEISLNTSKNISNIFKEASILNITNVSGEKIT